MRKLQIQRPSDHKHAGHQIVDIDENVDLAKALFEEAVAGGMIAYVEKGGERVVSREFDPEADGITVVVPLVGG